MIAGKRRKLFPAAAVILATCLPFLISCSFSRSTAITTPAITAQNATFQLERVSSDPSVYLVKDSTLGERKVFVSVFKECPVKKDRDLTATTRSLFVGLEQLDITKQSAFQYQDSTILESEATGVVDGQPISLLVYSERTNNCLRDLLLWTRTQDGEDSGKWKEILEDKDRVVDLLRKE